MTLRWITWDDEAQWHLRFGTDGPALCDKWRSASSAVESRPLSAGAPAHRCPDCATVIRFRLGLPVAEREAAR